MKRNFNIIPAIILFLMIFFAVNNASATRDGSRDNPYSCQDVIYLKNPGTKAWIKGYIVGTMNTNKQPNVFETTPPFEYVANVFLADNPDETDPTKCVPVQLPNRSDVRAQLNLVDNPGKHRAMVALHGDLTAYFSQPGLKNTDDFMEWNSSSGGQESEYGPGDGIKPEQIFHLTVSTPGTLRSVFAAIDADEIPGLAIKGKLNSEDIVFLNSDSGRITSVKYLDLSEITLDYDGGIYSTNRTAPEAGMGTAHTYNYILSEENYDELLPFDFIAGYTTNYYRNNLSNAFCRNNRIEYMILPKWLTSIGAAILYYCENLREVTLPEGVVEIGDRAFGGCSSLVMTGIPASVTKIGTYAFYKTTLKVDKLNLDNIAFESNSFNSCNGFKSLEITHPSSAIPDYSFNHCTDLKEIKLGEGLEYIGNAAFKNCKIETADLPSSLIEIGEDAFLNCPFLNSLPVEDNIRYIGSIAYDLSDKNGSEYTVREGTTMLAPQLFSNAANRPKVNLPTSVRILGKQSLSQANLTTMPDLPELRRIDDRAFQGCPLTSVVIPEKVELIHYTAFNDCDKIWKVDYKAIEANVVNDRYMFDRTIDQVTFGDKVQRIPAGLFYNNTFITEINLPASVTSLAPYAFNGCTKLEHINLNDNITEIGGGAFMGCSSLGKIHWPAHLKKAGDYAFSNCSSLETISLPEGMTTLGSGVFQGCSAVKNLYIPSTLDRESPIELYLTNASAGHLTVTCTAETPYNIGWSFNSMAKTTFRVPAASLDRYKSDPGWNGSYSEPQYAPEFITIESISPVMGDSMTSFSGGISSDTDLSDTVIGDVYVTLGENDGYDESDGTIVLNDSMADEYIDAIGGMAPGLSDLAYRFNGLVIQVPAGTGTVVINCRTIGDKYISVKIGNEEPVIYNKDNRGDITVDYVVSEDTYIYIYAAENSGTHQNIQTKGITTSDNCVKIYSIGINSKPSGTDLIYDGNAASKEIVEYWRLDGIKIDKPALPGIYIGRCSDGSTVKFQINK